MRNEISWEHGQNGSLEYFQAAVPGHVLLVSKNIGDKAWTCSIDNQAILNYPKKDRLYAERKPDKLRGVDPWRLMRATEFCFRHKARKACISDPFVTWEDRRRWMQGLLREGEALAEYTTVSDPNPYFCIVPDDEDDERIDIGSCLEETLYRILEAEEESDGSDPVLCSISIRDLICILMGADQNECPSDEESDGIEIDLGYRIHELINSFERIPLTAVSFEKQLYERYKLIWMSDVGITLQEAFAEWRDYLDPANGCDRDQSNEEAFAAWEYDCGFSGSLYPCFDEYVHAEYQMNDDRLFLQKDDPIRWKLDQPCE